MQRPTCKILCKCEVTYTIYDDVIVERVAQERYAPESALRNRTVMRTRAVSPRCIPLLISACRFRTRVLRTLYTYAYT